jgi:hypothetical protein
VTVPHVCQILTQSIRSLEYNDKDPQLSMHRNSEKNWLAPLDPTHHC